MMIRKTWLRKQLSAGSNGLSFLSCSMLGRQASRILSMEFFLTRFSISTHHTNPSSLSSPQTHLERKAPWLIEVPGRIETLNSTNKSKSFLHLSHRPLSLLTRTWAWRHKCIHIYLSVHICWERGALRAYRCQLHFIYLPILCVSVSIRTWGSRTYYYIGGAELYI